MDVFLWVDVSKHFETYMEHADMAFKTMPNAVEPVHHPQLPMVYHDPQKKVRILIHGQKRQILDILSTNNFVFSWTFPPCTAKRSAI